MYKYVVIDIDGTIADTPKFKDLDEFHKLDHVNFKCLTENLKYIEEYCIASGFIPIFATARCESLRKVTGTWLRRHTRVYNGTNLLMRPIGNTDDDFIMKQEILSNVSIDLWDIDTWFDDNSDIIRRGNSLGCNVFDVTKLKLEKQSVTEFKKFDNDKADYSLFEPIIMEAYCKIGSMGAKKYGRNNWKNAKLEDIHRYYAAKQRHDMAHLSGEELDPESNMPHTWHSLWNSAAISYFERKFGFKEVLKHIRGE